MNQSEFLNLVMPFKDKLFRLAKRILVSEEEAKDATQDVLLKLWSNKKSMKTYKNVEAFSMTMVKNHCFDRLKSKQAQNLKITHSNYSGGDLSLQQLTELKDSVNWVEKIINTLPEQQRLVVQLRDIEQLDLEEISKITQLSAVNVRVTLSRARKTIREKLKETHSYGVK